MSAGESSNCTGGELLQGGDVQVVEGPATEQPSTGRATGMERVTAALHKTVAVTFNTVTPMALTDVLTGRTIAVENGRTARAHVPCGLFGFLDAHIKEGV